MAPAGSTDGGLPQETQRGEGNSGLSMSPPNHCCLLCRAERGGEIGTLDAGDVGRLDVLPPWNLPVCCRPSGILPFLINRLPATLRAALRFSRRQRSNKPSLHQKSSGREDALMLQLCAARRSHANCTLWTRVTRVPFPAQHGVGDLLNCKMKP